jgi:thiol-disulfide isomerase/thioredoxin
VTARNERAGLKELILGMGKADRNRTESARARIAAQQAQQRKAEARRRMLTFGSVGLVALVVIVVILIVALSSGKPKQATATSGPLPAGVQADLKVPVSALAKVGAGSAMTSAIRPVTNPVLTSGGKPEMLYIGAEWCPYCAAERWAMAVALSRFGAFSPLKGIHSSSTDVYPNTATLTFYRSTYTSKFLVFAPVENEDINHALLEQPTPAQAAIWHKYDPTGGYPFIDIGNRYIAGTTYDPQVLQGLTWSQIAAALHDPSSPVAQGATGSANVFTAAICRITGNAPANVCTTRPVSTLESQLPGS